MFSSSIVLFALIVPVATPPLLAAPAAGDWPQWRGPNRDGLSADTGLLKAWPSGGPRLVWKAEGLGVGYSSVAVAGGRIFTMGDGRGKSLIVALDLGGKKLWAAPVGATGGNTEGTRCTPTVAGDLVFGLGQFGDLVCAEAKTGKELWRRSLEKDFGGRVGGWNYSESPLADGDRLVCAPGGSSGTVVALERSTGKELWRSKDYSDRSEYTSMVKATLAGKPQYVHLSHKTLAGIDPETGAVLWRAPRRGETAVVPTPICHEDLVYVTSGYGVGCNLFRVAKDGDGLKAEEVYSRKDMVNHHGGVVLVGDHLYGYSDGKGWVCQDLETGTALWSEKGKHGKGSIAYADGMLYLRAEGGKGTVVLIEATPEGWREKGRFDQPSRSRDSSWAHPVVAGGRLYLRDMDVLLCYDVRQR
ncbi:MAG: PQQ-like beta-propeller repeat protein [Planctomycetes bacterium]|nr:PQQ-like beta-propeller repeat protein [Planctomycetota bacterium]